MRTRRRDPGRRLLDFAGGLLSALLVSSAMAVQIVGPLLSQNLLSEIAAQGSTAQGTARTNLGISGTPPFMPLAGGTFTGPVIWNTSATATFMASLTGSPASANVTFSPTGTGRVIIAPATAGTIDNMVMGGVTPLAGHFTTIGLTGLLTTVASATGGAGINLPPGVAPTSPNNGDVWVTSTGLFVRVAGVTVGPLIAAGTDPLTSAHIFVGNASNIATDVAMSGDVAITNTGATTVSKIGGTALSLAGTAALGVSTTTVGAGTYYAGHSLIGVQTFCLSGCTTTSTGTYTPDAGTNQVIIEVQAAGGGGGGCAATDASHNCVGGSAAGGSYGKALFTSSFSGITFTIGAAGAAGTAGANPGGVGGTTSAGTLISCPGGTGGLAGAQTTITVYTPVTLGVASPSACTFTGGTVLSSIAGQASAVGFSAGIVTNSQYPGASGGAGLGLGYTGQSSVANTSTGFAGTGYGWGAGGSLQDASQGAATAGLAGGPSRIVVYEFN